MEDSSNTRKEYRWSESIYKIYMASKVFNFQLHSLLSSILRLTHTLCILAINSSAPLRIFWHCGFATLFPEAEIFLFMYIVLQGLPQQPRHTQNLPFFPRKKYYQSLWVHSLAFTLILFLVSVLFPRVESSSRWWSFKSYWSLGGIHSYILLTLVKRVFNGTL